jgi:hypothetical protein
MVAKRKIWKTAIPKGTELFHGTSARESFDVPSGHSWYSDSPGVAKQFVSHRKGAGRPRILKLLVKKRITNLALIESSEEYDALFEELGRRTGHDPLGFPHAMIVCDAGLEGWVIPKNYPEGADIMLCYPADYLELVDIAYLQPEST